jgi:hypothetical protein
MSHALSYPPFGAAILFVDIIVLAALERSFRDGMGRPTGDRAELAGGTSSRRSVLGCGD